MGSQVNPADAWALRTRLLDACAAAPAELGHAEYRAFAERAGVGDHPRAGTYYRGEGVGGGWYRVAVARRLYVRPATGAAPAVLPRRPVAEQPRSMSASSAP